MTITVVDSGKFSPQTGGANRNGSVTIPADTQIFYCHIFCDVTNNTANSALPSVYTLNGVSMTYVTQTPINNPSPTGQVQFLYKVDNPTAGTFTLSITAPQYFFVAYESVVSTNAIIATIGTVNYATSTAPSATVSSSSGNTVILTVVADATDNTTGITGDGSLTILQKDGGASRCGYNVGYKTSAGNPSATSWTIPVSEQWSALGINLNDDIYTIDSIDDPIPSGDTFDFTYSGFTAITGVTTDVSNLTVDSIAYLAGNGTARVVGFADGAPYPEIPTVAQLTFTDGTHNFAINTNVSAPDGFTKVDVVDPNTIDTTAFAGALLAQTGRLMVTGDDVFYGQYLVLAPGQPADLVMSANTNISVTGEGTFPAWLRVSSGADADKMFYYNVTITDGGVIIIAGGLTALGLTARGLTARGLTAKGL